MATIWRIMAHWDDPAAAMRWSKRNDRIACGWDVGSVKNHRSTETIKEAVRKTANPNWGVSGKQLWDFCHVMKHGDLVIFRGRGEGDIVAKVTGDYEYVKDAELGLHNQRRADILPIDGGRLWQKAGGCADGYSVRWTVIQCANAVDSDDL